MSSFQLVNEKTQQPVRIGDTVTTFRGESATLVAAYPPHRPGTSGKVQLQDHLGLYYAGVIGCAFAPVA